VASRLVGPFSRNALSKMYKVLGRLQQWLQNQISVWKACISRREGKSFEIILRFGHRRGSEEYVYRPKSRSEAITNWDHGTRNTQVPKPEGLGKVVPPLGSGCCYRSEKELTRTH